MNRKQFSKQVLSADGYEFVATEKASIIFSRDKATVATCLTAKEIHKLSHKDLDKILSDLNLQLPGRINKSKLGTFSLK